MGTVTALFVRKVVRAAGDAVDGTALLRSVGLDPGVRGDVSHRISASAYYGLLEDIAAQTGGAIDLLLKAGASMRCDNYGAFGLAWKTAPTLRDSFARAERYWRLLTSVAEYEVRPDGEDAWFILHRPGDRRLGMRMSNEATLASTVSIIREVSTGGFDPIEVHLQHPPPGRTVAHETFFGCPVIWQSDVDAVLVPGQALARRNRLGDEGVTGFLLTHLDAEMQKLAHEQTPGQQVRDAIARCLSDGVPRMTTIARRLGVGERTLQRKLGEEGLSFQSLVDDSRRTLAEGLLVNTDYSLAEIAFMTGFSEQSAFNRAFRRWHDQTPAGFRDGQSGDTDPA